MAREEEITDKLGTSRKKELDLNRILALIEKSSIGQEDLDPTLLKSPKKQRRATKSMLDSVINSMSQQSLLASNKQGELYSKIVRRRLTNLRIER